MLVTFGRQLLSTSVRVKRFSSIPSKQMAGEMSGTTLSSVITALENFAPKELAQSWDNTGLLVQPYTSRNITKILLTNDLTEDVALEANEHGCEMIVSYHPPIFAPLKSVTQSAWKERVVSFLLERRIALYSPHTAWDAARGGVNDWLATAFSAAPPGDAAADGGRLVHLEEKITLSEAVQRVKKLTGLAHVRVAAARGRPGAPAVGRVALCAGSGGSVLKGVDADLYLTGEMLHHDILDAAQKGISVILTNHSDSERGFLRVFRPQLVSLLSNKVEVLVSERDKDPLVTV